jgi:hypothetical protein
MIRLFLISLLCLVLAENNVSAQVSADPLTSDSLQASPFAKLLSKAAQDPSLLLNRREVLLVDKSKVVSSSKKTTDTKIGSQQSAAPSVADSTLTQSVNPSAANISDGLDTVWRSVYYMQEGAQVDTVAVYIESSRSTRRVMAPGEVSLPPGCVAVYGENDFLQLRARMAAAQDETEMLAIVRRALRNHCFSVSQVRRLGGLFLYDESRFQFFEATQKRLMDPENFSELQGFLTDPAYQRRFAELR